MAETIRLSRITLFPVKGLRGIDVRSADVDELGFVGDRRFLIVDEQGRFLSQRTLPRMTLVETALNADQVTLSAPTVGAIHVSRHSDETAPLRSVSIWKSEGLLAEDCGDEPAAWLGEFLRTTCRLVRIGPKFLRPMLKAVAGPGDRVNFADAFPFLVISEASLADLNDHLAARGEDAVEMERFRPNLVIRGAAAYAEDTWSRFKIGLVTFRAGGPCVRCAVPTIDPRTAERGVEPMRTLASYRRSAADPTDVNFGQNLIHETKSGTLHVGDTLEPA